MNQQNWNDSASVGTQAVNSVHRFLSSDIASRHWKNVRLVYPVEENPFYQKKDIDLILIVKEGTTLEKTTIEVKGDRNDRTGNLFLETVSDVRRNTEGAFLVCEADWYFYFFVESSKLFCIPMLAARAWFTKVKDELPERTSTSKRDSRTWSTKGRLARVAPR